MNTLKNDELLSGKIEKYILNLVENGVLKGGDRLISVRELSKLFNTSYMPVFQATESLVKKGLLDKVHGKGTFVRRQVLKATSQSEKVRNIGLLYWPRDYFFYQSPYYAMILSGVKLQAERKHQALTARSLRKGDHPDPKAVIQELAGQVEGFLIFDMLPELKGPVATALEEVKKPAVIMDYEDFPEGTDKVLFDHTGDTRKAVSFLIEAGHRRTGFIYNNSSFQKLPFRNELRIKSYHQTLIDHQLGYDPSLVLALGENDSPDEEARFKALMQSPEPPTALYCDNEEIAMIVYRLAGRLGLKIPDDLSVVSTYDSSASAQLVPALTTISLPIFELGRTAMRRLDDIISDRQEGLYVPTTVILPGQLIIRKSHRHIGHS